MGRNRLVIHPLTYLSLAVVLVFSGAASAWILVLSLTCHELAHLALARSAGVDVEGLRVYPFGAALDMPAIDRASGVTQAVVAMGGPLSNLLVLGLAVTLAHVWEVGAGALTTIVWVNAAMAAANLLPALPLDGGRVLGGLLSRRMGPEAARLLMERLSLATAVTVGALGAILVLAGVPAQGLLALALALGWALWQEVPSFRLRRATFLEARRLTLVLGGVLATRGLVTTPGVSLGEVMAAFRPDRYHRVLVVDGSLRPMGELTEEDLRRGLLTHGIDVPVGRLLR